MAQAETLPATVYHSASSATPSLEEPRHNEWAANNPADIRSASIHSQTAEFVHQRDESPSSLPSPHYASSGSFKRKPLPAELVQNSLHGPELRLQEAPSSPVNISPPQMGILEPESASILMEGVDDTMRSSRNMGTPDSGSIRMVDRVSSLPIRSKETNGQSPAQGPRIHNHSRQSSTSGSGSGSGSNGQPRIVEEDEHGRVADHANVHDSPALQYHAFPEPAKNYPSANRVSQMPTQSVGSNSSGSQGHRSSHSYSGSQNLGVPRSSLARPASTYALGTELRGRNLSPLSADGANTQYARDLSSQRKSPQSRPHSYVELLANVPYNQQIAPGPLPNSNAGLQSAVGSAASLLDTNKTLNMYRANVKKTKDAAVQYEFAIFMLNAARDAVPGDGLDPNGLQNEAKSILQSLSDRAYPFAQYYLADGYFSGLFNKGKPDYDKAFPLFNAASKHGHAEAGYRAALCYEFGWGTARSNPKAQQFYKAAASKNHPGAATRLGLACLRGDMGLDFRVRSVYRDGVKWLKRAQESADPQYNAGPYELGILHLQGHGDDIFKDEAYAAQLLTQAAELGHMQANFMMGQAYENGLYGCPKDAALSVHFYNGAATRGQVEGMMALCAWYMVGAEPVLDRDEAEAYAWAKMAAEAGYAKAEYAIGYFTEMGIGCRRDPLEANVWYVRAADQGNETATQRLAIIRSAASGDPGLPMSKSDPKAKELQADGKEKKKKVMGLF